MYSFSNHFSKSELKDRIWMINRPRSGWWALWRYGLLVSMSLLLFWTCQKTDDTASKEMPNYYGLAATNPTRGLVADLEQDKSWVRMLSFYQRKNKQYSDAFMKSNPVIVGLSGDKLIVLPDHQYDTRFYVNGKEVTAKKIAAIPFNQVKELFAMEQLQGLNNMPKNFKVDPMPYRLLVETTPRPIPNNSPRNQLAMMLTASAISKYPFGESFSFTMNSLLEAMFFGNKTALVQQKKNDHLQIYDEFKDDISVFINRIEVDPKEVETVHVREVARLYTRERPYDEWLRSGPDREKRFVLYIDTEHKRAKRDSSYYVFSPFYSGDF